MLKRIYKLLFAKQSEKFDETGERVDIMYSENMEYDKFNIYQKSHYKRYEYAVQVIPEGSSCADFACGTGYGSIMLSKKAANVTGVDINKPLINAIKKRYSNNNKVTFFNKNLLNIDFEARFDAIVSFETIEHFKERDISKLLAVYFKALKPKGMIVFSTPYMQERTEAARKMGHHLTFGINEATIEGWLNKAGYKLTTIKYQNYTTHDLFEEGQAKDFIVCVAFKI